MERSLDAATTEGVWNELLDTLRIDGRPSHVEAGVIALMVPSVGRARRTLLMRGVIRPLKGDVKWSDQDGLTLSRSYRVRAAKAAREINCGVAFIHSHPLVIAPGVIPRETADDREADARDLFYFKDELPEDAPLVAGVVGSNGQISLREYRPSPLTTPIPSPWRTEMPFVRVENLRVVGAHLKKLPTVDRDVPASSPATESSALLWGAAGQRILGSLHVAIVGAGGVGSILTEHVARLGVRKLSIVDFDYIDRANFNRSQGATKEDVWYRHRKIEVALRNTFTSATYPDFEAVAWPYSAVENDGYSILLDADVILNASDSHWSRQVLDGLAYAHLIPVIDGGTDFSVNKEGHIISAKSQVTCAGPGHPCLECLKIFTRAGAGEAREKPQARGERGYIFIPGLEAQSVRSPSVIATNTIVAGLMELRLLSLCVGITPRATVGQQEYHILEGTMEWSQKETCDADCEKISITASGDNAPRLTGIDLDKAAIEALLSSYSCTSGI